MTSPVDRSSVVLILLSWRWISIIVDQRNGNFYLGLLVVLISLTFQSSAVVKYVKR